MGMKYAALGKKIVPPKYVYHITKKENVKNILEKGLVPKIGFVYESYVKTQISLYNIDVEEIVPAIFCTSRKPIKRHPGYGPVLGYSILKINTSLLDNEWFEDLHHKLDHKLNKKIDNFVTNKKIKIEAIMLIAD